MKKLTLIVIAGILVLSATMAYANVIVDAVKMVGNESPLALLSLFSALPFLRRM